MADADATAEADAAAEAAAQLGQSFRAEDHKGDDQDDEDLEWADISKHRLMVTRQCLDRITFCGDFDYPVVGFCREVAEKCGSSGSLAGSMVQG